MATDSTIVHGRRLNFSHNGSIPRLSSLIRIGKPNRSGVTVLGTILGVAMLAWLLGPQYFGSGSAPASADRNTAVVTEIFLLVDVDAAVKEQLETLIDTVRVALRGKRIGYRDLGVAGDGIMFELRDSAEAATAMEAVSAVFPDLVISEENGHIEIALTEEALAIIHRDGLQQTNHAIERDLKARGAVLEETRIQRAHCIVIRGVFPETGRSLHIPYAKLKFQRLVGEVDPSQTDVAAGEEVLQFHKNSAARQSENYAVRKRILLWSDHIVGTSVDVENGDPVVTARVDYSGRQLITERFPDSEKRIAIVLNDQIITVVRVARHSPDRLTLHGDFSKEQADELAELLMAGAWGWPVEMVDRCPD